MKSIEVRSGQRRYEVLIGSGLLQETGRLVRPLLVGPRCAVISDDQVAPLFAGIVNESLQRSGYAPDLITIEAGEAAKSFGEAGALCERMGAAALDRTSFVVSLGGGVVSDLAGFVAAIYHRGIPYISIPTTLLAQVDSCIGGKTGVNSSAGKNLIGAFHHPSLVLADTDTLLTLPERIWNEGFAEAIKHGIIRDPELLAMIPAVDRRKPQDFVARNLALKAEIVAIDEREETGARSLLNFGHTVGHAIEHAAGYGNILHGEAISLGMVVAAHVSARRAGLSLGEVEKIAAALETRQLPVKLPADFPREKIFASLPRDKKFENGRIRFVVAHAIGRASVSTEVTIEDLRAAVDQL
ncbi:MAG TPA: 3-dehydroquinate synthase [Chthoniobacterales bacterium]